MFNNIHRYRAADPQANLFPYTKGPYQNAGSFSGFRSNMDKHLSGSNNLLYMPKGQYHIILHLKNECNTNSFSYHFWWMQYSHHQLSNVKIFSIFQLFTILFPRLTNLDMEGKRAPENGTVTWPVFMTCMYTQHWCESGQRNLSISKAQQGQGPNFGLRRSRLGGTRACFHGDQVCE